MKRRLLTQIRAEWRSNIWLAIELTIISVVLFYIVDFLWVRFTVINEPLGFNVDHCYRVKFATLPSGSPEYIPDRTAEESNRDILTILDRLGARPEVESVAMGTNAHFYNSSNSGELLTVDTFNTGGAGMFLNRMVSPDFPKVFRIYGAHGESPEKLASLLENPLTFLISDDAFKPVYGIGSMREFIGKDFSTYGGDTIRLVGTYSPVRYDDYVPRDYTRSMMRSMPKSEYYAFNELVVRVHDNMDNDFAENLMKDADSQYRVGNYFISAVDSFKDIRFVHQRSNVMVTRFYFTGGAFLAMNIFLGLLGTFWFRTRRRIPEIAIRMVNGATRGDILRRVVGEGELILLLVTPLAIVFDYQIVHLQLNQPYENAYFDPARFAICVLLTLSFMALMILAGVILPAVKAMRLQPAVALKSE